MTEHAPAPPRPRHPPPTTTCPAARRPGDRRATLVEVTEHGAGILAEIRATRGTEAGRVFGRLGPADRAELARILSKLRE